MIHTLKHDSNVNLGNILGHEVFLNSSIHPILTPDTTVFGIMYHFMEQTELSKLNAAMCKLLQFHFDDLNQNSCGYWKIIISINDKNN